MQPAFLGPSGGRGIFVDLPDLGRSPRGGRSWKSRRSEHRAAAADDVPKPHRPRGPLRRRRLMHRPPPRPRPRAFPRRRSLRPDDRRCAVRPGLRPARRPRPPTQLDVSALTEATEKRPALCAASPTSATRRSPDGVDAVSTPRDRVSPVLSTDGVRVRRAPTSPPTPLRRLRPDPPRPPARRRRPANLVALRPPPPPKPSPTVPAPRRLGPALFNVPPSPTGSTPPPRRRTRFAPAPPLR